jgi:hypothetical protein
MEATHSIDRRAHCRADLPATAVLLRGGVDAGRYIVQNLSAAGALLPAMQTSMWLAVSYARDRRALARGHRAASIAPRHRQLVAWRSLRHRS